MVPAMSVFKLQSVVPFYASFVVRNEEFAGPEV